MTSVYYPEDWLTMRAAVQAWLENESGVTVVIQEQNAPSPAKPFIRWGTLVPPVAEGRVEDRNSGIAVSVKDPVEDNVDYTITLDSVDYTCASDADATVAEILQGLIDAMDGDFAASVVGTSSLQIEITADTTVSVTDNLLLKTAQQYLNNGIMTLTFEVLTDSPDQMAFTLSGQLSQSLESEPVLEVLDLAGLELVSIENRRKTAKVTGAQWEDRAGFDVRFRVRTRNVKVIDFLDNAGEVDLNLGAQE